MMLFLLYLSVLSQGGDKVIYMKMSKSFVLVSMGVKFWYLDLTGMYNCIVCWIILVKCLTYVW